MFGREKKETGTLILFEKGRKVWYKWLPFNKSINVSRLSEAAYVEFAIDNGLEIYGRVRIKLSEEELRNRIEEKGYELVGELPFQCKVTEKETCEV